MIMIMGFINQLISRLQPSNPWLREPPGNNPIHHGFVSRVIWREKGLPDLHGIGPTLCSSKIQCRISRIPCHSEKSWSSPFIAKKNTKKMSDKEKSITRMNSSSSSSTFLCKFGTNLHQFEHIILEILEFRTMLWSLDMLCSWWFGHVWNIILEMFQLYPMLIMILMAWTYRESTPIPQNIESKVRVC